jgi:hypothetical protein
MHTPPRRLHRLVVVGGAGLLSVIALIAVALVRGDPAVMDPTALLLGAPAAAVLVVALHAAAPLVLVHLWRHRRRHSKARR